MNAHELAKILLKGNDYPVFIRTKNTGTTAEAINEIFILQKCDSPFEYAILLEGVIPFEEKELIDIDSI